MALGLALAAAVFLAAAFVFHGRAQDPSSTPPGIRRASPASNRVAFVVTGGVGALLAALAALSAGGALGILGGATPQLELDPRGAPIDPMLLLGDEDTLLRPRRHVPPTTARTVAAPCGVGLVATVFVGVASWWLWRLPAGAYVCFAIVVAMAATWLARVLATLLAELRLHVRFTRAPRRASPGGKVEVEVELRPHEPVRVDAVHVLLAGLEEVGGDRPRVHVRHREVRRLELGGELGRRPRRFRCAFQLPADAHPTSAPSGGPVVRWIVAAHVDIPSWPDAARVHEVQVVA